MSDYKDESLVYVDPRNSTVLGFVEWSKNGNVVSKAMPVVEEKAESKSASDSKEGESKKPVRTDRHPGGKIFRGRMRKPKIRYYPWCSYKTAKKLYKVEGKQKEIESQKTLEDVLERALKEPFWDD